jgi:DNA polymerase III delta prime subunit
MDSFDKNIPWVEKYRPKVLKNIVLEEMNRELFNNILAKKYFPNLIIYGPPGCGKTTVCMNIINEYQEKYSRVNKSNIIHLNASDERGIDIIRNQIYQFVRSKNLFEKGLKFVILDEVDYMTKNAQYALKYILQTSYTNIRFCLICNYITKIDESLKNEFMCIRFNQLPESHMVSFMKHIIKEENLSIDDKTLYTIQEMYNSDMRSMVNYIQLNQNMFQENKSCISIIDNTKIESMIAMLDTQNNVVAYTSDDINQEFHAMSVEYNIDKRSILQKIINYIIRYRTDIDVHPFLNVIEIMQHRHDIPIDIHITSLYYFFQKLKLNKNKTSLVT